MDSKNLILFFQLTDNQDITEPFDELDKLKVFFSYFQVDDNYYLFLYSEKKVDIEFLYHLISIKKYLNKQKRRLRSFRGYFLYALEIQRTGDLKVLKTNLNSTFWSDIDSVLRQNRRDLLLQFLFEKPFENNFNEKIDSRLILQKIETIETNFTLLKPEEKVLKSVDNVKFRDLNLISNEEMEIIILEGAEKKNQES